MAKTKKIIRSRMGKKAGKRKRYGKRAASEAKAAKKSDAAKAPAKPQREVTVKVTAAKGRPMLTWVGKRPLSHVTAFPPQLVERHEAHNILGLIGNEAVDDRRKVFAGLRDHWNAKCWEGEPSPYGVAAPESGGLLLHGDNLECLASLLAAGYRGKVDLIYIDPPFDSGADYVRTVKLRGSTGNTKLDGETYTLGEQIQYADIWSNDNYLQFMYERLLLLREILGETGSIYVHCDPRRSHHLRSLLDEVFGADSFRSEVIWKRADAHSTADRYGPIHDNLLYYSKGESRTWNVIRTGVSQETADTWYTNKETIQHDIVNRVGVTLPAGSVRRYNKADISAPGSREGTRAHYEWKGHYPPAGRHWAYTKEEMDELDREGRVVHSSSGKPYEKRYLDEAQGAPLQSLWIDIQQLRGMQLTSRVALYPTEKPEDLLERIVRASSNPGDIVLDCFLGSGTTAAVAQKLGRRWIGCDINRGAIETTVKRLRAIITEQIRAALADKKELAGRLFVPAEIKPAEADKPKPCQFGFTVWQVNDYDLQIQHNEAVNIACEHIGVQRTRSDSFFDGVRGKKLVKVIPFDHPLSPVDLEELRRELDARPEEARNITLVCLGMELAARAWVEDWNRLRKGKDAVNRIDVIELRTDPQYGKFLVHSPARAKVTIARKAGRIHVTIEDFISPTIVERLRQQAGVVSPKTDDWRAMVDSVMIDTAYDGKVLNVALADVPEKKSDLVAGTYELPAPSDDETTVAVRITDMLGEEALTVKDA